MNKLSTKYRLSVALAVGALMALGGAASASATWTWAGSTNPITMIGGRGYGQAMGVSTGTLTSTLADTQADGQRVYANLYGNYYTFAPSTGLVNHYISAQSGRRTDGGSALVRMANKTFTPLYGTTLPIYNFQVRLCRDKAFAADPCSDDIRTHKGL